MLLLRSEFPSLIKPSSRKLERMQFNSQTPRYQQVKLLWCSQQEWCKRMHSSFVTIYLLWGKSKLPAITLPSGETRFWSLEWRSKCKLFVNAIRSMLNRSVACEQKGECDLSLFRFRKTISIYASTSNRMAAAKSLTANKRFPKIVT
jgi:hypothetical protein